MSQKQNNKKKILKLVQQLTNRQQQYIQFIRDLKSDQQKQGRQYIQALTKFLQKLQNLSSKQQQAQKSHFAFINGNYITSLDDKIKREYRKKQYKQADISKIGLNISMKFMYFTPYLQDVLTDFYPHKLQIKFDFHHQKYQSEVLKYANATSQQQIINLLKNKYPFVLQTQINQKTLKYQIKIQLNQSNNKQHIIQILTFFHKNSLNLQLWDSQTNSLYAQTKIPLHQLLYYQQNQDIWTQSFEIYSHLREEILGKISIQFRNSKFNLMMDNIETKDKLKVVSKQPISINKELENDASNEKQKRILKRINKYKQQSGNFLEQRQNIEIQTKLIQNILKHKQLNKTKFANQIILNSHKYSFNYTAQRGKPTIIPIKFVNSNNFGQYFYIRIQGIEKQANECKVVTNGSQWQYYCKKYGYKERQSYDIVNSKDLSFYGYQNEQIIILLKYLCFNKNLINIQKEIRCQIMTQNGQILQKTQINIKLIQPYPEQKFRIYQFQNTPVNLKINHKSFQYFPNFYIQSDHKSLQYLSIPNQSKIHFKFPTQHISQTFYIFIYSNQLMFNLLNTYKIQLHTYPKTQIPMLPIGKQFQTKVQFPLLQNQQQVIVVSSNPNISWIKLDSKNNKYIVKRNTVCYFNLTLRIFKVRQQNLIISCLRNGDKHMIYEWLFKIRGQASEFKNVYEIVCSKKLETKHKIQIQNPKNKKQIFSVLSENNSYVRLNKNKFQINQYQVIQVEVVIMPNEDQQKQIILNICDRQLTISYNLLLKLKYDQTLQVQQND